MGNKTILPVILAGGSGERLWPLSRTTYPKQFINLFNQENSLLQTTVERLAIIAPNCLEPLIICNEEHRFLVAEQLRAINIRPSAIILEPSARNTAPAIATAALWAQKFAPDCSLLVLPADHNLANPEYLSIAVNNAQQLAQNNYLVTFGIKITQPHTGYGYIELGAALENDSYKIAKFIEKPAMSAAITYAQSSQYVWNSGMFMFTPQVYLTELDKYEPNIFVQVNLALLGSQPDLDFTRLNRDNYAACPAISIDYAIMEHSLNTAVIPVSSQLGWSDIGCWEAILAQAVKDEQNNFVQGNVVLENVNNCLIDARQRLVAAVHVDNLAIIETADAVLVTDLRRSQDVKHIVQKLKQVECSSAVEHRKVLRPWGWYDVLFTSERFQVKHVIVHSGKRLSLQKHRYRSEHWVVVKGVATVRCDEREFELQTNQSTFIPLGAMHQLINNTPDILEIVEVQSGSYLGEDDIIRYEDDYGRVSSERVEYVK